MTPLDPDDRALAERFAVLTPPRPLLARGDQAVRRAVLEQQTSLSSEWVAMLRARPVANGLLVAAAAAALLLASPLGSVWSALAGLDDRARAGASEDEAHSAQRLHAMGEPLPGRADEHVVLGHP
jgi:hypothetical protein